MDTATSVSLVQKAVDVYINHKCKSIGEKIGKDGYILLFLLI